MEEASPHAAKVASTGVEVGLVASTWVDFAAVFEFTFLPGKHGYDDS